MRIWAIIAGALCSVAHAAWDQQFSGLWLTPAQPGWATSVHQQGNHAVATVLTYRADGKAKWYQAQMTLPEWNPYILWGTVSVSGTLIEGGTSRSAGSVAFRFDEDHASVRYVIDGLASDYPITRFVFAPVGFQGGYIGWWTPKSNGACRGRDEIKLVNLRASNTADNGVGLALTIGAATCTIQAAYGYSGSMPQMLGRAQCTGLDGISETTFQADDVRIDRDTVSFNFSLGNGDCGYYGPMVAARTDKRIDDSAPPHDDASGLWDTVPGWSIDAHLQGNQLFATVLAADGSWYVAPGAAYASGQDGDFVQYRGNLWSASKTRPNDPDTRLSPAGGIYLTVDAGGYSNASYGGDGSDYGGGELTQWVSRRVWPRDDSISGSYVGVRTSMLGLPPSFVAGGFNITEDAGVTRITMGDINAAGCEFSGTLQWEGPTGRIDGTGSCRDAQGILRSGNFSADEIRITDQGITMRHWSAGGFGSIAGVRR